MASVPARGLGPASLALVPLLAWLALGDGPEDALAPLAGGAGTAELAFEVRARGAGPMPARLTFVPAAGGSTALFGNPAAAPEELAARDNVLYTRTGRGRITLPPGRYEVVASRGLEWSLAQSPLVLAAGERASLAFELERELDTRGWIGGDFHLHTLTHSGHGDASVAERVLSLPGEGLEFAVATDHDHLTDYRPTLHALGLAGAVATVTGDEVSTPIGHFNAFPLDPRRAPVDSGVRDANVLFRALRAEPNELGIVPLIQLNHPRLAGIDYFGQAGLDPVTGTSAQAAWSRDFDAIEVLNENLALGYRDPVADRTETHGHRHSAVVDWFHLLNRGERYAAVGNSDSHHVRAVVAGYPRNFVRVADDDPARVDLGALAAAVRAKQLFTTTGPFVELEIGGATLGGEARAEDGHALLHLCVRAASWVDCDRAKVFVNGDLAATLSIPPARTPLRLEAEHELCFLRACARHGRAGTAAAPPFDGWVVVVVEGDEALEPVLRPQARPLALTNPVWIDGDGDGRWTSPLERVGAELAAQATPALALAWFAGLAPEEQALALDLAPRGPVALSLLDAGLASSARAVRLAAARVGERHTLPGAVAGVQRAWKEHTDDPFLGALLVRALARGRPADAPESLRRYASRFGAKAVRDYGMELLPLFAGGEVARWRVLGPLPAEDELRRQPGPPILARFELPAEEAAGPAGPRELAPPPGLVDLGALGGEASDHRVVYAQTFLHVPEARTALCAFGSDDGSRVWLGERLVYENRAPKSAAPLEALLELPLEAGWNRLVLEIENVTGDFGFHCRLLAPGLETRVVPP